MDNQNNKHFERHSDTDLFQYLENWESKDKETLYHVLFEIKNRKIRLSFIEMNIFKKIVNNFFDDRRFQTLLLNPTESPKTTPNISISSNEMLLKNVDPVDYSRINTAGRNMKMIAILLLSSCLLSVVISVSDSDILKGVSALLVLVFAISNVVLLYSAGAELTRCGQENYRN